MNSTGSIRAEISRASARRPAFSGGTRRARLFPTAPGRMIHQPHGRLATRCRVVVVTGIDFRAHAVKGGGYRTLCAVYNTPSGKWSWSSPVRCCGPCVTIDKIRPPIRVWCRYVRLSSARKSSPCRSVTTESYNRSETVRIDRKSSVITAATSVASCVLLLFFHGVISRLLRLSKTAPADGRRLG